LYLKLGPTDSTYELGKKAPGHYLISLRNLLYLSAIQFCPAGYTYEVGQKAPALHVLMSEIDPANAAQYGQNAMTFFNQYLTQSIPHTAKVCCTPPPPSCPPCQPQTYDTNIISGV